MFRDKSWAIQVIDLIEKTPLVMYNQIGWSSRSEILDIDQELLVSTLILITHIFILEDLHNVNDAGLNRKIHVKLNAFLYSYCFLLKPLTIDNFNYSYLVIYYDIFYKINIV